MDANSLGMVRTGKPMLSQHPQQQTPNRYSLNSYYSQPTPMPYPQQSQVPSAPHRSLSQNTTPSYSTVPTSMPSNGAVSKSSSIESMEFKSEDSFVDLSKLQPSQSQQQQQMFHPLIQSRSRPPSTSYYSNMPPTNNTYYPVQRPLTPSSDYNMNRLSSIPANTYGTLPVQQRVFVPPSTGDLTTGINNNNTIGLQSTPPPPSVTPH